MRRIIQPESAGDGQIMNVDALIFLSAFEKLEAWTDSSELLALRP